MSVENNNQQATLSPKEALQALILDPDLERLEDLLAEFNLFDVLGIARRELQHSAFLAWLLDPRGSHGLRDYFLRHFLSQAAAEVRDSEIENFTPFDVDGWKLSDIEIEVATERHNIDILLVNASDGFVCLIENKIGAAEQPGQLGRYLRTVQSEYEGLTPLPIFLTPNKREPEDEEDSERWVPLDYQTVADLITRVLDTRGSIISGSVMSFLEQYKDALGRHVLVSSDNIDELALQIYNNHRAAIDLIINAKPASDAVGWDVVDAAVEQYAPLLQADFHSKWYRRFYSPLLDDVPGLREGRGWTASGRILLFEFKYHSSSLGLIIGPGPEEARKRLYELAQRDDGVPGVRMRRSRSLSKEWHTIYSKRFLRKGLSLEQAPDQARPHIERSISEFYENDYWPLVNAIREEFGLSPATAPAVELAS